MSSGYSQAIYSIFLVVVIITYINLTNWLYRNYAVIMYAQRILRDLFQMLHNDQ